MDVTKKKKGKGKSKERWKADVVNEFRRTALWIEKKSERATLLPSFFLPSFSRGGRGLIHENQRMLICSVILSIHLLLFDHLFFL